MEFEVDLGRFVFSHLSAWFEVFAFCKDTLVVINVVLPAMFCPAPGLTQVPQYRPLEDLLTGSDLGIEHRIQLAVN